MSRRRLPLGAARRRVAARAQRASSSRVAPQHRPKRCRARWPTRCALAGRRFLSRSERRRGAWSERGQGASAAARSAELPGAQKQASRTAIIGVTALALGSLATQPRRLPRAPARGRARGRCLPSGAVVGARPCERAAWQRAARCGEASHVRERARGARLRALPNAQRLSHIRRHIRLIRRRFCIRLICELIDMCISLV